MRWMLPFPKHSKVILFYPCSIGDQRSPSLRGEATRRVGWKIIKDEIVVWVLGGSSGLLSFIKENKTIEKHLRVVFAFSRKFMKIHVQSVFNQTPQETNPFLMLDFWESQIC